jgi:hypothetical protein
LGLSLNYSFTLAGERGRIEKAKGPDWRGDSLEHNFYEGKAMPEPIETKRCSHCNTNLPTSQFYKDRSRKDCLACYCKSCSNNKQTRYRYNHSDKGKVAMLRYEHSAKGKAYRKVNHQSAKYKESHRLAAKSAKYKESHRLAAKKDRICHTLQNKARASVHFAIKMGQLPKAKDQQCSYCVEPAIEYHHHLGYEPQHWLDVVPVCKQCHTTVG